VGIRELCTFVGIKPSSFYNHFPSKEKLFDAILDHFSHQMASVVFTPEEREEMVASGDVGFFLQRNMQKFAEISANPVFFAILQIVQMECFTHERAFILARRHVYWTRKEYTEEVLARLMQRGAIKECDVAQVTAEYYYALKGLLDEFLLLVVWDQDTSGVMQKIQQHIAFFVQLLKKE